MRMTWAAAVGIVMGCIFGYHTAYAYECSQKLVCDSGYLLNGGENKQLTRYHQALLERYDMDYRVVVESNAGDLAAKAVELFKIMNVGDKSKTRKGLMLLIDPTADKVRLEISAGLDAVYTDAFVAYLEKRQMVPFFKAGRVADGILATTELLVTRAQKAALGEEFIAPQDLPKELAIGAGAQTEASIGKGEDIPETPGNNDHVAEGLTPLEVVQAYHQALADKNASPSLDIYSQQTKVMRKQWVVTEAQMASELAAYQQCVVDRVIELKDHTLAVVRYKVDQRRCAPYYLVREEGQWKLDFVAMSKTIRYNIDNEWHVEMSVPTPYNEAYDDWSFNKNGYPFPMKPMRWGLMVMTNRMTKVTWIKKIYEGTPAESMGFKEGDVILSWRHLDHPDYKEVVSDMDRVKPGDHVDVIIERGGQQFTLSVNAPPYVKP